MMIFDYLVPVFILIIIVVGIKEKKEVYNLFIEGVVEAVNLVFKIMPYIFTIIFAVNFFEKIGGVKYIVSLINPLVKTLKIPLEILPLMLVSSLSGSASSGIMVNIFENLGPDSYAGRIASLICGGSETTFYILSIFFGTTKVKKTRTILLCALLVDFMVIFLSIFLANYF